MSATGAHVGRFALPGEVTIRRKNGNSGDNSAATHGNSDPQTAIHSPGEEPKCEESGNSRPGKFAFIKLKKEGSDMEGVRETAEASDMEGVRETAAASRILPGTPVLEFYPDTSSPSLPTRGNTRQALAHQVQGRRFQNFTPPACVSESGRELCTCLVQTGAKSSPDSQTMLGGPCSWGDTLAACRNEGLGKDALTSQGDDEASRDRLH